MMPGNTALTRMPRAALASPNERVRDITPALAAAYTVTSGMAPVLPAADVRVTTEPASGMRGQKVWSRKNTDFRFTSSSRTQSLSVTSAMRWPWVWPWLIARPSTGPSRSEASKSAARSAATVTSARNASAPVPRIASRPAPERATPRTDAPRFTSSRAAASPMPEPAPVTTTRRPSNSRSDKGRLSISGSRRTH